MAIEKYLLDEMTPEAREEFEEHFFDCQECAIDLRMTAQFMDSAKREFKVRPVGKPGASPKGKLFSPPLWWAVAACLLVIAYQNTVVFPRFETQMAALKAPEILPSISLVGGNSRGGHIPAVSVGAQKPFLLSLDIPTDDRYSSYTCLLYSPSHALFWKLDLSAQVAKDTVSISVPAGARESGEYTLTVQGNLDQNQGGNAVHLMDNRFTVNLLK